MSLPTSVTIREVGPRDGIQSLGAFIPTEQKIELVDALSETGITRIEATSFVHPRLVPQMADGEAVMRGIRRRPGATEYGVADTTGMANPLQVERLMTRLQERFPRAEFGLHFHNTRGMGLANVVA